MNELTLNTLADSIRREHEECKAAFGAGLTHAMECGRLLIEAKSLCAHGEWMGWLSANTDVSERTAQAYMQLHRNRAEVESKAQRVADLPMREALALLAEPRRSDPQADYYDTIPIASIEIGQRVLRLNQSFVAQLAESIRAIGLITPIVVRPFDGRFKLVSGWHRVEALKLLGADEIYAHVIALDDLHAQLAEIDENLTVKTLTVLERGEYGALRAALSESAGDVRGATPLSPDEQKALREAEQIIEDRIHWLDATGAAVPAPDELVRITEHFAVTAKGLVVNGEPTFEEFLECGRRLARWGHDKAANSGDKRDRLAADELDSLIKRMGQVQP